MNNPFLGTGVAIITPFNSDKSIDHKGLSSLVEYQIQNGIDYIVVQGTTGESPVLSWEEKLSVLETVSNTNNGRVKIVFGIGGNDTLTIGKTLSSFSEKVDGILSVSPYYNKPSQEGIIEHYKYIASKTELPIILYNVPGRTGSKMSAGTILELAQIKNIVAVKEASGDFEQVMEIIQNKPEGFDVISGDDIITYPLMSLGVVGVISVVAQAFPKLFSGMVNSVLNNEYAAAKKAHYELMESCQLFFKEGNPGGVKASLSHQGFISADVRLPLTPVSEGLKKEIIAETDRLLSL